VRFEIGKGRPPTNTPVHVFLEGFQDGRGVIVRAGKPGLPNYCLLKITEGGIFLYGSVAPVLGIATDGLGKLVVENA